MKLFVSALEYSANVHLRYLLRELALCENVELCGIFDESILDSARSAESSNKIKLKKPFKSFCYFWLKPKVESPLPLNHNLPNSADSADLQNLGGNQISGKSLCDTNSLAVMGFIDVLKKAKFFLQLRAKCLNLALTADKILLMDSSSFNIPLAKMIKSSNPNKRIIYYILPQVWAWKPWRAKAIEANCDKLAAILPFEVARYEKKAKFVGHPLLDEIQYFRGGNSLANLSCGDFSRSCSPEPSVLSSSLASHERKNSSTILEFASCKIAESNDKIKSKKPYKSFCYFWLLPKVESPLPFNHNLPNNADSAKISGLPRRFCESARNDKNLDSSLRKCSAQNDNVIDCHADSANPLAMTKNQDSAESSNIFSFMPGSRFAEIKRIFPIFLQVKNALKSREKDARFHLIIPQKFAFQNLGQIYGDLSDFHISFDAHLSLFQSRFAFICSGTATLECALIGTPFVLGYKCRALEAFIARCFLKIKFIGLANILYEKISPNEIFHTELIQGDLTARNLLNALDSADKSEFLRKSLALRKYLKNGSASAVAKMLYDL